MSEEKERVKELFLEAMSQTPTEQAELLERATAEDPRIGTELRRLLAHSAEGSGFLETPLQIEDAQLLQASDALTGARSEEDIPIPTQIGQYEVTRRLGIGGMGEVYEARQETPPRTVAVKVIRTDLASASAMRRFRHEAEVLARLEHASIAHVYDAGMADVRYEDGSSFRRLFFAMEYVAGHAVTEHADGQHQGTRDRIRLMAQVCDAVHHAHQKGIIHRDLKPGNILVKESGQPKILDFGVARATEADVNAVTLQTTAGQLIGTIPYMSPEQLRGDISELDIRTDVYALGAILYQLLGGRLPHDVVGCSLTEAIRRIDGGEPPRLADLNAGCRGDLETIVHKALERDATRRYQSAAELAADLRRYLDDEPITARPASLLYQLRKFARRNPALVYGVLVGIVALTAGAAIATWQAVRATREAEWRAVALADSEAARDEAEAVVAFLTGMLTSADPASMGRDVLVTDVLEQASATVATDWADRPLLEARVRDALASTYHALGHYAEAEPHARCALAIRKELLGPSASLTLGSTDLLMHVLTNLGRFDEAEALGQQTLALRRGHLPGGEPALFGSLNRMGVLRELQGRFAEAEGCFREALDGYTRIGRLESTEAMEVLGNLGYALDKQGKWDEAEECVRAAADGLRRMLGADHPRTLLAIAKVGSLLSKQGKLAEALPYHAEVLERRQLVLGEDHPQTLTSHNNMGRLQLELGENHEAETHLRVALEGRRRILGNEHPQTLTTVNNLAAFYYTLGRYAEAEPLLLESTEGRRRTLGDSHPDTINTMNNLAMVYLRLGRLDESERGCRGVLEAYRQSLGDDHPHTISAAANLGSVLRSQGKHVEAEAFYRDALEQSHRVLGDDHPDTLLRANNLGLLLLSLNRLGEAERYLRESLEGRRRTLGDRHVAVGKSLATLAMMEASRQRYSEAAPLYAESLDILSETLADDDHRAATVRCRYASVLAELGRYEDAERELLAAYEKLKERFGSEHRRTLAAVEQLADLYETWGKPERSQPYRALLPQIETAGDTD